MVRPAVALAAALLAVAALVALALVWHRRRGTRENLTITSACQYVARLNGKCPEGSVETGDAAKPCLAGCVVLPSCQYTQRTNQNGTWACPAGWTDSGLTWGVPNGDKQCYQCPVEDGKRCSYTVRAWDGKQWRCPDGTIDTGRTWGMDKGDKQCLQGCCPTGFKGKEGGTSDLFACGAGDITRQGGIRRGADRQPADELAGYCCQWTNKDCKHKGFAGLFQSSKDIGTRPTGYYTEDDGCNVNVWDQSGKKVAVTGKGAGLWGGIAMMAAAAGGLAAAPFTSGTSLYLALGVPTAVLAATQINSQIIQKGGKAPGAKK